jgi:hypothetical protein
MPRVVVALTALGMLASCTWTDGVLPDTQGPPPPPAAVLGPPRMRASPIDPRFSDALTRYATALRVLPGYEGAEFDAHLHATLRLLANSVALVPSSPAWRQPAFDTANVIRSEVAAMEITFAEDPRAQVTSAGRALVSTANFLGLLAAREYPGATDVAEVARRFAGDARAVGPDRPRAALVSALHAAQDVLTAMLRAAIAES